MKYKQYINKITLVLTLIMLPLSLSGCKLQNNLQDGQYVIATIGSQQFNLEVATSDAKKEKGLSGKDTLDNYMGMFFVFSESGKYTFWMKNTLIPLQIIWLDENFQVVDSKTMTVEVDPENPRIKYIPSTAARYAIEINPGQVAVTVGDKVAIEY